LIAAGEVLAAMGDSAQASTVLARVARLARDWDDTALAARAAALEGRLELQAGRLGAAARVLQQAVARYQTIEGERSAAFASAVTLAAVWLLADQTAAAERGVELAHPWRSAASGEGRAYDLLNQAWLAQARGDGAGALAALQAGLAATHGGRLVEPAWQLHQALAVCLAQQGDAEGAAVELARARDVLAAVSNRLAVGAAEQYRAVWLRQRCLANESAAAPARPTTALPNRSRELHGARTLLELNKLLGRERELDKLLVLIMDHAIELTRAERGVLLLERGARMDVELARDYQRRPLRGDELLISRSIVERVVREGQAIVATNAAEDERLDAYQSVADLQLRSVLCVPLAVGDEVEGALYVDNRFEKGIFDDSDLALLEAFADQAALAVRHARLHEENVRRASELALSKAAIEELNRQLEAKVATQSEELLEIRAALDERRAALALKHDYSGIVGASPAMQRIFTLLDRVVETQVPVYIHGESGTGKELVARAIHYNGARREQSFIVENCGALAASLLESELFGYVKGAFTGADQDRQGLFELADRGTLFLDEVGDMSAQLQKSLLRVLQEGELRRIGGKELIHVDVRVISASNKDLAQLVAAGEFREDLYYRLNVLRIDLPPLRERIEDLPALVARFLDEWAELHAQPRRELARDVLPLLAQHEWPGNIRELRNVIFGALSLDDRQRLEAAAFASLLPLRDGVRRLPSHAETMALLSIDDYTRQAIQQHQDQLTDTELARQLGISRKTLWEKRKRYNLARPGS
jgi:transcriptional regulator with GAF, ATPase, and Fis domain